MDRRPKVSWNEEKRGGRGKHAPGRHLGSGICFEKRAVAWMEGFVEVVD